MHDDVRIRRGVPGEEKLHLQDCLGRAGVAKITVKRVYRTFENVGRRQLAGAANDGLKHRRGRQAFAHFFGENRPGVDKKLVVKIRLEVGFRAPIHEASPLIARRDAQIVDQQNALWILDARIGCADLVRRSNYEVTLVGIAPFHANATGRKQHRAAHAKRNDPHSHQRPITSDFGGGAPNRTCDG